MWGVVLHNVVKPVAIAAILHVVNDLAVQSTTFVCANKVLDISITGFIVKHPMQTLHLIYTQPNACAHESLSLATLQGVTSLQFT